MRRLSLIFLVILFLFAISACATPSPAPTLTALPAITPTALPTIAPTAMPSPIATARPKTGEADAWLGKAEEREKLFDQYAQTIKDGHVISDLGLKRLGTTWEKELQRAKKRFAEADTKTDVYYALLSLQRSFHDAHSMLTTPKELVPSTKPVSLPFTLAVRGNSLENARYTVIQSSLPELKSGLVLKLYQNKTIPQLEYDYSEWLDSTSPEALKQNLARALTRHTDARQVPAPDANTPVTVIFVNPETKAETSHTFKWQPAEEEYRPNDYERLTVDYRGLRVLGYKDTANDTLVLVDSRFSYSIADAELRSTLMQASFEVPPFDRAKPLMQQPDWARQLLEANGYPDLAKVKGYSFSSLMLEAEILTLGKYLNQQSVPNLLIDVRDNPGGDATPGLIALFAAQRFQVLTRELTYLPLIRSDKNFLQAALTRSEDSRMTPLILDHMAKEKDAVRSPRFPFNCRTTACNVSEAAFAPLSGVTKFNLAILSGPRCVSACDQVVAIVQDNALGRIVGLPARGGHSPFRAPKDLLLVNIQVFTMIFNTGIGYRPNGEPLEGNPAAVEYYLFPEDDYLNKIIKYLKQGHFK